MKFHALICARAGSKGIKNKNIRQFKKKPLISYPIELAKNIKRIESVSVSTDSRKIANISKYYGADIPFIRSKKLSSSKANEWDVWKDFVIKKIIKNSEYLDMTDLINSALKEKLKINVFPIYEKWLDYGLNKNKIK